MSAPPPIVQDMPPKGGYAPLNWKKTIRPKTTASGVALFAGFITWSVSAYLCYKYFRKFFKRTEFEMIEAKIALEPFMLAETDRHVLKALWVNREEERELMKDEPGWVVGTWYGDKVFTDTSRMIYPTHEELYAHCNPKEYWRRIMHRYWTRC